MSDSPQTAPAFVSPYPTARAAQRRWAALSVAERCRRLSPAITAMSERMDELAAVIHDENGKPLFEAVAHEITAAIGFLRWVLDTAPALLADAPIKLSVFPHRKAIVQRVPWGVVLVIGPWNVPFYIPISQVAPALAAGNAVVLKPSEVTPRSARLLAEVFGACDLPEGLLQIAEGDGALGAALIESKPDKVMFTGSVATGRKVMAACARHPIPVTLELGGVDAMIVAADADLEYASSAAVWGATFNGGQVCASVERLIVHRDIEARFTSLVAAKLERLDRERDLGPITFAGQRAVYQAHLADARDRGLELRCGGDFIGEDKLAPTLISGPGVTESKVWLEETFGPVVATTSYASDDEAVRLHNSVSSGLTASVFSRDLAHAKAIASKLRAGLVSINDIGATLYSQPELPWGGVGTSGFGRSHGEGGILDGTWPRVIEQARVDTFEPKRPWWYPYGARQQEALAAFGRSFAAAGPLGRLGELARAGRAAWRMLSRTPRL